MADALVIEVPQQSFRSVARTRGNVLDVAPPSEFERHEHGVHTMISKTLVVSLGALIAGWSAEPSRAVEPGSSGERAVRSEAADPCKIAIVPVGSNRGDATAYDLCGLVRPLLHEHLPRGARILPYGIEDPEIVDHIERLATIKAELGRPGFRSRLELLKKRDADLVLFVGLESVDVRERARTLGSTRGYFVSWRPMRSDRRGGLRGGPQRCYWYDYTPFTVVRKAQQRTISGDAWFLLVDLNTLTVRYEDQRRFEETDEVVAQVPEDPRRVLGELGRGATPCWGGPADAWIGPGWVGQVSHMDPADVVNWWSDNEISDLQNYRAVMQDGFDRSKSEATRALVKQMASWLAAGSLRSIR